ncbi:putative transcription factor bHLH family [Lupinus albus]|uniref:Putative transcription factor bHLH family n=2 Tax=Lupinus albus TaxID=3870 RepID=A0A6A4P2W6_LUPAL|nr:putative transcription factor bHLH family [Lupinus albus]
MVLLRQGMQQFRNYYNSEVQMRNSSFPWACITETYNYISSKPKSKAENKEVAAKKHSEAEKKRRTRINDQYNTLRHILPNIINQHQNSSSVLCIGNEPNRVKTDKASILAETIKQLRKLEKSVPKMIYPSWEDELTSEQEQQGLVKVTLNCDDRPGLILAVERAVGSVKARVVKAELVTVGGRAKFVLWVQGLVSGKEGLRMLRRTLKVVMHKPVKMQHFNQQLL